MLDPRRVALRANNEADLAESGLVPTTCGPRQEAHSDDSKRAGVGVRSGRQLLRLMPTEDM